MSARRAKRQVASGFPPTVTHVSLAETGPACYRFGVTLLHDLAPASAAATTPPGLVASDAGSALAELCVVIPVLNERDNVAPMVEALRRALDGVRWEAVFVDDNSRDGTREAVAREAARDPRVRLIHRYGRKGLASAFVEGALASFAPYVAAMDGDLQHDETVLPAMLAALREDRADVVIGSRYVAGGGIGTWDKTRAGMSDLATKLGQRVLRVPVADPMSGFFMVRRPVLEQALPKLSALGFKILLDLLASLPEAPRVLELPYQFRLRQAGESKLDAGVMRDYALLLGDKMFGHIVPVRFAMFAVVGAVGIVAHLVVLRLGLFAGLDFSWAQGVATAFAILGNFTLNNEITFRDMRLRGAKLIRGLLTFALISSVGAVANIGIADLLFGPAHSTWWFAGLAGAILSFVWNYAASSALTWRRR
jgi:dolichol-phosphate mannosyltransferase